MNIHECQILDYTVERVLYRAINDINKSKYPNDEKWNSYKKKISSLFLAQPSQSSICNADLSRTHSTPDQGDCLRMLGKKFQHYLNPLHVYCRLRDLGVSKPVAVLFCRFYEWAVFKWIWVIRRCSTVESWLCYLIFGNWKIVSATQLQLIKRTTGRHKTSKGYD